jgi:methanogenic corrinoid protein MtbC1/DNA-binding XRE family transcriptional regulator
MDEPRPVLEQIRERYLGAALKGDGAAASFAVEEGLRRGCRVADLLLAVIGPAQRELGELWQGGHANVAQEHLGTQIALAQMERLRQEGRPRARLGTSVVVTTVEGEEHWLGARMMADLLALDGWDALFLGPGVPSRDLRSFVLQKKVDLVVLSVTMEEHLPRLQEAVAALRCLERPPKILAGGAAVAGVGAAQLDPRPDAISPDALRALRDAQHLLGLRDVKRSLEAFLKNLGERVQAFRKAAGWSQQQLADRAGLDRTYISAAEHGKQNLTLGAVMKLADALDVPIERLLIDPR